MSFVKVHALGNDFVLVDGEDWSGVPEIAGFVWRVCDRHTGVGADGLLLTTVTDREAGRADFRIFNADGSEPEISGNGLRCAAAYLFHRKKILLPRILFRTPSGERECELLSASANRYETRAEMGTPRLAATDIPFDDGARHETVIDYPLSINQETYPVTALSMGNPHCAVFVDRFPARIEWHQIGREIESHPFFPQRVNIEFVRVINRGEIEVLFWERGVGETLASGSGACAAAAAAILKGRTGRTVTVRTSLGALVVDWDETKNSIFQSGPAEIVFEGRLVSKLTGPATPDLRAKL
ncbi:MAG: diaminopimelate epimerase [Candidatus Aminicenantes bacterium]|nr:diaminopimelate epimerase [Candidatus Aminicenantes bacterium]